MPKALSIDWKEIEQLYLQGITPTAIQRRTGVKATTIQRRAVRYEWRSTRDKLHQNLSQTAPKDMLSRAETWQERISNLMESRLLHLEGVKPEKLRLSDLEALARITDLTDKQMRRNLGLDQEKQAQQAGLVNVHLHVEAYQQPMKQAQAQAIDATPVSLPESTAVQHGEGEAQQGS